MTRSLFTLSALLVVSMAAAEDIVLEDYPVNYGIRAKPNILLAVDDSGSMDVEMSIVGAQEGYGYWGGSPNSFVDGGAPRVSGGDRFTHLFPFGNGTSGASSEANRYNGGEKFGENYVPPYDAYGFTRSSDWNNAYYDPEVEYEPWPTYGGYGWPNITPTEAWLDPALIGSAQTARRLDLTADVPASAFGTGGTASFDSFTGMWCDNSGTLCTNNTNINEAYWAATYFVADTTSEFTVDKSLTATTTVVDPSDVIVLEAEDAALGSAITTVFDATASVGEAIEFNSGTSDLNLYPGPEKGAVFNFTSTATTVEIWVRRKMPDGSTDSLWMAMDGHLQSAISPADVNAWESQLTPVRDWHQWRDGHEIEGLTNQFVWEKWADVDLIGSGPYTLNIRQREIGVGLDQIAIVQGTAPSFSSVGALSNTAPTAGTVETLNCGNSADLNPALYQAFHDNRAWFNGVDAFAPDGSCLERVQIRSSRTTYPSGRSYEDELQNFANWFTYYRKRHQVARGALGSSLQGIRGIRSGLFWINNRRTIDMYDLDEDTELKTLLGENYYRVSAGGTPNRAALNHAGSQFDTNQDIIQYSCQKNYTLMFTDGYWNGSFSGIGNYNGSREAPYADNVSNTLADISDYYYNRSLRAGTLDVNGETIAAGKVPVPEACTDGTPDPWLDCNANLHMNTYTVSFGLAGQEVLGQTYDNGTISGVYDKVKDAHLVPPTWPSSIGFDGRTIDDMYHAAINGRGEMYYAQRPQELKDELQAALRDILATEGSAAGLTFNSATLNAESLVFNTIFNTTNWTGDLIATKLDPSTGMPTGGDAWRAQAVLDDQAWDDRHVIAYNDVIGQSVLFEWDNLTALQKSDLSTSPSGAPDTLGQQRLDYLRGDRSEEGSLFRERLALLGDMVSSTPAYVANTSVAWPDHNENSLFGGSGFGESHSYFRNTTVRNRDPMIYVGANDGMLHGFDATNGTGGGTERLAYIPSPMFSSSAREGLHFLSDPDYTHRFYVDAEPAYSDVFVNRSGTSEWRTILSGGFRTGAKGFYALDITNPDEFTDANVGDRVLFEYADLADPYLGYMFERPSIGMLNNGEWALIYGNGYNSIYGEGAIYVVFIERVLADGWIEGDTFMRFPTEVAGAINGITAIDYESDRVIDAIYASDAGGYVWKLDLTAANEASWGYAVASSGAPEPFYEAVNDDGERQPIITRPRVIKHTSVDDANNNTPNRMVIFGTGSMVEQADLNSTDTQSFYAVWDDGSATTAPFIRSDLLESEVTATTNSDGFPQRELAVTSNQSPWGGSNQGFYFDMPLTGERVLDYIDIRESKQSPGEFYALFSSVIPDSDVCSYGGVSWIMAVDLRTGAAPTYAVFDTNQDGVIDENDEAAAGVFSDDYLVDFVAVGGLGYGNTSTGEIVTFTIEEGQQSFTGRMGWQELIAR